MEIVITEKDIDINLNKVVATATRFNLLPTKQIEIEGFMAGAKAIAIAICTRNRELVMAACEHMLEWRGIQCDDRNGVYKNFIIEIFKILNEYIMIFTENTSN